MRSCILLIVFVSMLSCSKDDDAVLRHPLAEIGILGNWEIQVRGIDNVTSTEVLCCEFLMFSEDNNTSDLMGFYSYQYETTTNGTFSIDSENASITMTTENDITSSLFFNIESNILKVWYFEDESRYWSTYSRPSEN